MTGAIVLATKQGLGILAKSFYDNGIIDKVFVWKHSTRENNYDWYPNRVEKVDDLLDCDKLIFFETCFDWTIIPKARAKGIKTILIPMYECTPSPLPYNPDVIISPSLLDQKYYPNSQFIRIPVNVKWKQRDKALVFVHNAGNGGLGGRNGTKELLEAMKYVKSPIKLIVRSQVPIQEYKDPRIEYRIGDCQDLWSEGDVFVFPEKFNGLSLPLQEAFASGMAVITTDRFPNDTYLPKELLIPVKSFKKERITNQFDMAIINPVDIASVIDRVYNTDIISYSLLGKKFNEQNSWTELKNIWNEV
jgi:glycosyltransferase involved in cell wall biosynthesis